jgi:hypothetical protein
MELDAAVRLGNGFTRRGDWNSALEARLLEFAGAGGRHSAEAVLAQSLDRLSTRSRLWGIVVLAETRGPGGRVLARDAAVAVEWSDPFPSVDGAPRGVRTALTPLPEQLLNSFVLLGNTWLTFPSCIQYIRRYLYEKSNPDPRRTSMSLIRRFAAKLPLVVLLALCFRLPLSAQQPRQPQVPIEQLIRLGSVEAEGVSTPQFDVSVRGMSTQRDGRMEWLMVRAEYKTAKDWTDEVTVTFYVVLEGDAEDLPAGSNTKNMFTGTVTYMNVRQGDHESTMFLDPNTFERYGDVIAVAAVVNLDGRPAGELTDPSTTVKWWERQSPLPIPLLNRSESPWALIEIEKHDTIKP